MSGPPVGFFQIHPVDAPEGDYLSTSSSNSSLPVRPVVVDDYYTVWQVTLPRRGNVVNLIAGLGKPGPTQLKGFNRKNVFFVTSPGPPGDFRIESAGPDVWVIGIPSEDLLLTYDEGAYPPLTFQPANGSSAQRFQFLHPQPPQ